MQAGPDRKAYAPNMEMPQIADQENEVITSALNDDIYQDAEDGDEAYAPQEVHADDAVAGDEADPDRVANACLILVIERLKAELE